MFDISLKWLQRYYIYMRHAKNFTQKGTSSHFLVTFAKETSKT